MAAPLSFAFLTALPYFLRLETDELRRADKQQFHIENVQNHYPTNDFIVGNSGVGGGTAGCVVASRLSKHFNVLLIEAGGDPPSAAAVPAFHDYLRFVPNLSYNYTSVPQRRVGKRLIEPMAKMMGGSASHNGMVYNRGNPKDYDVWAQITRDPSWSYDSVLKFYRAAETYIGIWPRGIHHGSQGPLSIATNRRPMDAVWKEAAVELGYRYGDPNGPQTEGFFTNEASRDRDGRRSSTYTAYIKPIITRKTLTIIKYATVEQVIISRRKAVGVRYVRHGVRFTALASKEVIISAGPYGSPVLLFKSGIGPQDMLANANIHVHMDLPAVGENLQDHYGVSLGPFEVSEPSLLSNIYHNLTETGIRQYLDKYCEPILCETGLGPQAFFVSPQAVARGEANWPDISILIDGEGYGKNIQVNQFYTFTTISRAMPFGTVKLNITAYLQGAQGNVDQALIDYKFLERREDYETLLSGIQHNLAIFQTPAFRRVGATLIGEKRCAKYKMYSDKYWKCYVDNNAFIIYHASGTCRMSYGADDLNSVVDSRLRVHGIESLRIVDASVMPLVTNANTQAPTIIIAEKGSATILHEYAVSY